jgi:hypothetical protein
MQPVIETEPIIETRGDDWQRTFRLKGTGGAAFDLTGYAVDDVAIKWSGGSLPLTQANWRLSVNAAGGEITIDVSRTDNPQVPDGQRSRLVLTLIDTLSRKSTLVIIPIRVIIP